MQIQRDQELRPVSNILSTVYPRARSRVANIILTASFSNPWDYQAGLFLSSRVFTKDNGLWAQARYG